MPGMSIPFRLACISIAFLAFACEREWPEPHDGDLFDADGDADVDADSDSDGDVDSDSDTDEDLLHPARYTTDRTLSPITPYVAEMLRDISASSEGLQEDVFAKVGASATKSLNFLHCFDGDDIELDGREELRDTILYFRGGEAGGVSPFERESLTVTVGWSALHALRGDPSPLEQELEAIHPRYAVVMYGTNDIQLGSITRYSDNMMNLVDLLLDWGVIPVMSSIMPRDDSATADEQVPRYNMVVRGIAQALQVPFIDYHRELVVLPDHGLAGDGVHPNVHYESGSPRACFFDDEGLLHGYNIRNLITIHTLDRVRRVLDGDEAPDEPGESLMGDGSPELPFYIDELPFSDLRNTLLSSYRDIDEYPGCSATQDESGPELYYELDLAFRTTVRAMVFDRGDVDIDIHLLDESGTGEGCLERDHNAVVADLDAGIYYLVVDTFVSSGEELAGEYLLVVMEED